MLRVARPWLSRWVFEYRETRLGSFYSAELDGLRGVAVVVVVLFHLGVPGFAGGWLGVDAFFVISGYLITGIILAEIEGRRFSYSRFLLKRAQRLLPALSVMTLVTMVFAWITFEPAQFSRFGDSLVGVAVYASNLTFMLDDGYFEQSIATTPLLHTWSLAVEEQFYLVFPLLLLLLVSRGRRSTRFILFALTVLSLAAWLVIKESGLSSTLSDWSFFLLPTRAWEFGAGALLAMGFAPSDKANDSGVRGRWLSGLGVALLVGALYVGGLHPGRGIPSILIVVGTILLLRYSPGTSVGRFLSTPILLGLGALSYGIYLWHFPIIAFAKLLTFEEALSAGAAVFVIVATLGAALLSLKFVENPIRLSTFKRSRVAAMAAIFVLFFAASGLVTRSINNPYLGEVQSATALTSKPWVYFSGLDERIFQEQRFIHGVPPQVSTVVVGSSRVMQVGSNVAGEPVLNLSVSGASIEDLIALSLTGLRVSGAKKILLGVDPWLLHENSGQNSWIKLSEKYEFWTRIVGERQPLQSVALSDIPSNQLATGTIHRLYRAIRSEPPLPTPADGSPELLSKKAQDGAHIYPLAYSTLTEAEKAEGFSTVVLEGNMDDFVLSEAKLGEITSLLAYLQKNNVEVALVLSPYHPDLFPFLAAQHAGFSEAESIAIRLAENSGVALLGSYNPTASSCLRSEFYDGMHPTGSCMKKALETVVFSGKE